MSLAPRGRSLRDAALPYMGDLADATRQHVLLAVRQDDEAILIERLSGQHAIPTLYDVGGRMPLHSTGIGLVLLAFADSAFRVDYLARPLTREPEHTPIDRAALDRTLDDARRQRSIVFHRLVPTEITHCRSAGDGRRGHRDRRAVGGRTGDPDGPTTRHPCPRHRRPRHLPRVRRPPIVITPSAL